ncbi:o-succinylbenzoate--CoA ligase [Photobacterium leiognathi]|uniref:o-succinylbenzoate--CoA ligase n=1 Tax=Photobacterium leiognathi TaxID=553611 RepID=UPI0029818726|nr:o-succinylbenzoate--CoA ligase [Photobacterium leiognathi]
MAEIKHDFLTWPWQRWAAERPSDVAISLGEQTKGSQTYTWAEVSTQVDEFAQGLVEQGVKRDQLVAVIADNTIDVVWLILAIIRVGARYVGLNPKLSFAEIQQQLAMLDNHYLWSDRDIATEQLTGQVITLRQPEVSRMVPVTWQEHRPVTLTLTSGSTGSPKAVVHSPESHLASASGLLSKMTFNAEDSWLLSLPLFHISGLAILWRWLYRGACLVIVEKALQQQALSWVTHASLVPTQLQRLLDQVPTQQPIALKQVLLGGAHIPVSLTDKARSAGIDCWCGYGMTEMASTISVKQADESQGVGNVLPNRELFLREGEILVRGKSLCLGYYRNHTIFSILDNHEHDGEWFATKDMGEWRDDELFIHGRADNMFISGGENVQPEDIEAVLLQLPGVEQAFVLPVDDYDFGQRPVAIVQTSCPFDAMFVDHVMTYMAETVAPYKRPVRYLAFPDADIYRGIKVSRTKLAEWLAKQ